MVIILGLVALAVGLTLLIVVVHAVAKDPGVSEQNDEDWLL